MLAKPKKKREKVRRKPAAARKETPLKMMTTKDQRQTLQAAADRAGMSLSTWIRAEALRAAEREGGRS